MRGKFTDNWSTQLALSGVKRRDDFADWGTKISFLNSIQLAENWQWNIWLRYSSGDSGSGLEFSKLRGLPDVDTYVLVDTNLVWSVSDKLDFSLVANSLGEEHTEARREEFIADLRVVEPFAMLKVDYKL